MNKKTAKYIKYSLLYLLLFFIIPDLKSQNKFSEETYLHSTYNTGFLLPEYEFVNLYARTNIQGLEISLSKKTSGSSIWHKLYNFPEIGTKYYFTTLSNKEVFGNLHSLSLFSNIHYFERNKFNINSSIGLGGAYVTEVFDPVHNFRNIAMSSHLNIYFYCDINFHFNVVSGIYLVSGLNFNHISNATLKQPNIGLNFTNFYSGLIYRIGEEYQRQTIEIPKFIRYTEKNIVISYGLKSTNITRLKRYVTSSFSINISRHLFYKYSIGIGYDFIYDSSAKQAIENRENNEFKNLYYFYSGLNISNEFILNKLSLTIQFGAFVFLKNHVKEQILYNKAIVKYKINNYLFADVALKTHLVKADFLEFGIGYIF